MFNREIKDSVNQIVNTSVAPKQNLIDNLVKDEIQSRTAILTAAYQLQGKLEGELKKIDRPDEIKKNRQGEVVQQFYSDERRKQIEKIEQTSKQLEERIQACFPTGENQVTREQWNNLEELIKKN